MKYSIEINGEKDGDIKTTFRSDGPFDAAELARAVDSLIVNFGIRGKEKVADFACLLVMTSAIYEDVPREVISFDLKSLKKQQEEGD